MLEGDEFGSGGFAVGRALVGWWRAYYTDGKGFHNEDAEMLEYRRKAGAERRKGGVTIR